MVLSAARQISSVLARLKFASHSNLSLTVLSQIPDFIRCDRIKITPRCNFSKRRFVLFICFSWFLHSSVEPVLLERNIFSGSQHSPNDFVFISFLSPVAECRINLAGFFSNERQQSSYLNTLGALGELCSEGIVRRGKLKSFPLLLSVCCVYLQRCWRRSENS